jgi:hypothetical protein
MFNLLTDPVFELDTVLSTKEDTYKGKPQSNAYSSEHVRGHGRSYGLLILLSRCKGK